ncbi:hypothetical protein ACFWY9_21630 [Amycolatopsis sp. NPDC059027]|uniref:hypothetical protein n=1 Tax=unclassified Amycolatopsis TaxID=2618356 RepID=UPI00366E84E3
MDTNGTTPRLRPRSPSFDEGHWVEVTGGQYGGNVGMVIIGEPDLRPGTQWVRLVNQGAHLIPAYRLTRYLGGRPAATELGS